MAIDHNELQSFLFKFAHLSSLGFDASLKCDCDGGKVTVILQSTLYTIQDPEVLHAAPISSKIYAKPSRIRRRQRRREARLREASHKSFADNVTVVNNNLGADGHEQLTLYSPPLVDSAVQANQVLVDVACQTAPCYLPKQQHTLSIVQNPGISISSRPIYDPAIINASRAFFNDKHPSELNEDEVQKFNCYLRRKQENGEPIESDVVFRPSSMRNCLHCGNPT